jgi:hypothetical protein
MLRFPKTLQAAGAEACKSALKSELETLQGGSLPLASGTAQGGLIDDSRITATVFELRDEPDWIRAGVGIFFSEIVGGCSCGDDPIVEPAYCRLLVTVDRKTAEARFEPVSDEPR